jgi:cyanophycinase-like exopeptidase
LGRIPGYFFTLGVKEAYIIDINTRDEANLEEMYAE